MLIKVLNHIIQYNILVFYCNTSYSREKKEEAHYIFFLIFP